MLVISGGTLSARTSFTLNSNRGIALGPTSDIDVASGQTLSYGGIVADNGGGIGGLAKTGAGTLVFSGSNTYSGNATISGGVLSVGADNNLGGPTSGIVISGGTLSANASFTSNRSIALLPTSGSAVDVASGQKLTYTGNMGGSGGLSKTGAGTLYLSPPVGSNPGPFAYTGVTTVLAGTLKVGDPSVVAYNTLGSTSGLYVAPATFESGVVNVIASFGPHWTPAESIVWNISGTFIADDGITNTMGAIVLSGGTMTGTGPDRWNGNNPPLGAFIIPAVDGFNNPIGVTVVGNTESVINAPSGISLGSGTVTFNVAAGDCLSICWSRPPSLRLAAPLPASPRTAPARW